jgi:hypothetical protein
MKREAKHLLNKATNSLLLSVDHFNCLWDIGRSDTILILLDHSFEMLLKASLVERGAKIRGRGDANTIGFDHCVRKGLTDGSVKFLDEDQVLTLQMINNYRDAAQHYLLDVTEELLYITVQSGLTVFKRILADVFIQNLGDYFPSRALPISTRPPQDIAELFHDEVQALRTMLQPGKRQRTEALARLRPLAIMEDALNGRNQTPSDSQLGAIGREICRKREWHELFPGVASIQVTTNGYGPSFEVHITKKAGIPLIVVPPDLPHSGVLGVKRVNELDFYNLSFTDLVTKTGMPRTECLAIIWHLNLKDDPDCFKEFVIGSQRHKRYSQRAIGRINEVASSGDVSKIRSEYNQRPRMSGTLTVMSRVG